MRKLLAILSVTFAFILVIVSMTLPSPGVVDESIIYIFAQLLIFAGTMLGIDGALLDYLKRRDGSLPKKRD